jgi:hypothetical protein
MGANKVGTQLLVSPHTRERILALAIVRKERLAEVSRVALEGSGLKGLERQHSMELAALEGRVAADTDESRPRGKVLEDWFRNGTPA